LAHAQVVVFSWLGCPYCKKAKALLSDLGARYTAVELATLGAEGKALRAELAKVGPGPGPGCRLAAGSAAAAPRPT
jgi:hypothetical protein